MNRVYVEMTLLDLIKSTYKFMGRGTEDKAHRIKVKSLNVNRAAGTRTILFNAQTLDKVDTKTVRSVQIQFIVPKGEDINSYKPSISRDRALVRSSCPWYKYAFGYNNQKNKVQYGRVSPFVVKGTGRPVNPGKYPGIDKHLWGLILALKDNGLIVN